MRNFLIYLAGSFLVVSSLASAPRYTYKEEPNTLSSTLLRELRDSLDDSRHELSNHEVEIRAFEEKLKNQDATVESLRKEMLESHQTEKKWMQQDLSLQISSLELSIKNLIADCKQLKEHSNKTATLLNQHEQMLGGLTKTIERQNQNISNLDLALQSIMEAFQVKTDGDHKTVGNPSGGNHSGKTYSVKSGDSLEKIAKENHTTVQAIKEMNPQLTKDLIIIGHKLTLP